jgi:hypothetical protein
MNEKRVSAEAAGYLEFDGAVKDADCQIVNVEGGVSSDLGCCNLFGKTKIKKFSCGTCEYVAGESDQDNESKPLNRRSARGMSFEDILSSQRPVEKEDN